MRLVQYTYPAYRTLAPAFDGFARSPWADFDRLFAPETAARFPVEVREDKDNTFVRAELPGVNRADIAAEIVDGSLTITVTQKVPGTDGKGETAPKFSRSVSLNEGVQTDKVTAAYENGVLTVTLPKAEAAKPRQITIS
jgi:HSP20 family protein